MEQWEVELRKRLEEQIPHGSYNIGTGEPGDMVCYTGKYGRIEFEVALQKLVREKYGK